MTSQLELAQKPFIELQVEALVEENRIKPKRVLKFIDKLETRIVSLKGPQNAEELNERFLRLPIIGRPNSLNDDYPKKFKFIPPERVDVVGGFRTSTAMKRTNHVDLAMCMPAQCFNKDKDIKNQRYHQKRSLYLAYLAQELNSYETLIQKLEFKYHQGDFMKPVLIITPKDLKLRESTSFQLFVYPPNDVMKLSLLGPGRGNVAPKWFFQDYLREDHMNQDEELCDFFNSDSDVGATPFYNSNILFDLELVPNSDLLFDQIGTQISITDALILIKIWLFQRELHTHFSFIMSMFVAYLQTQQLIHQNMSPYQIFKVIISSIANSDWSGAGLSYYEDSKDKIASFQDHFPVVFLSPSGNLNLCYNITSDLYARLKHEAEISQVVLNSNQPDTFDLLLLKKIDFINKFDVIVHLPRCTRKLHMNLDRMKSFMDHGVLTPHVYSERIMANLKKALTDRVTLIQQSPDHLLSDKRWNLRSIPHDPSNENSSFTFGLLLDPEKSIRIIDVGPDAQSPEAEEFRKFWEPKSQLRLQNGIISETVVWHVNSFSQRRAIIKYILTHALKRLNINNIVVHYTMLESFINMPNVSFKWKDSGVQDELPLTDGNSLKRKREDDAKFAIGVGEDTFQRVLKAYNELNKVIRSVENMKHDITTIQPISPHLRGSAVFPPLPVSLQPRNSNLKKKRGVTLFPENFNQAGKILHIEPVEVMLTLDSTGKWPSDPEALEAARQEYLIGLGEGLKEKEYTVKFAQDYLDVLHGQFVFRLRVKCPKQLTVAFPSKLDGQRRRLDLDIMPRVHAALDQLYRERPAFGLTCRLVKRWVACHLMTDHISDMALDLIVAHLFLNPQPYNEPASSSCGFKRFLKFMSQFEWDEAPLVVNFDDQLKLDEISNLQQLVANDRSKFSPMVIVTPFDNKTVSPWTKLNPTSDQLKLLRRICTKAMKFYIGEIVLKHEVTDQCKALFRPNFKLFKLLIKLNANNVQNFFMSIQAPQGFRLTGQEPSGSRASALKVMPIVGMNIVERYVGLLREKYDRLATFFYDKYGQRVIGVMLKPEHEGMSDAELNELSMNFKQLGSKLVESVTKVKHDE